MGLRLLRAVLSGFIKHPESFMAVDGGSVDKYVVNRGGGVVDKLKFEVIGNHEPNQRDAEVWDSTEQPFEPNQRDAEVWDSTEQPLIQPRTDKSLRQSRKTRKNGVKRSGSLRSRIPVERRDTGPGQGDLFGQIDTFKSAWANSQDPKTAGSISYAGFYPGFHPNLTNVGLSDFWLERKLTKLGTRFAHLEPRSSLGI